MKKREGIILTAVVLLVSTLACTKEETTPSTVIPEDCFWATCQPETKTTLDAELNIHWQKDDAVGIFVGNTAQSVYVVKKKDAGGTSAILTLDEAPAEPGTSLSANVAYYPQADVKSCASSGDTYKINVSMPSVQTYAANSFGVGAMPMVAVTTDVEDRNLSMKNLYGALRLKFCGNGYPVKSITITGNSGEKIAGKAVVTCSHEGDPTIEFDKSAKSFITLDCGNGVPLDSETETVFLISLPPITFSNGFTVTIEAENGTTVKNVSSSVTIARNTIKTMSSASLQNFFALEKLVDEGGNEYERLGLIGNHYTFCVPKGVSITNLKAVYATDATSVTVSDVPQESGVSENDFTSGLTYNVQYGEDTVPVTVTVFSFDLPALYVETPNQAAITSKETWINNTIFRLWSNTDASIEDLEGGSIKGRGNSTWNRPKKPYAVKLSGKKALLGMPADKRWNLLANYIDRTAIRNAVAFEIARKTDLAWTPNGRFVELILNGEHKGNYYLCEHIKLAKDRVNITEMSETDIEGEAVTGGYITEITTDDVQEFTTDVFHWPVNIKEPDEDVIQPEQIAYLAGYFNTFERILKKQEDGDYRDYIDMDSFIDWWLVFELTMNHEPNNPKSCYMYKDRGGKIFAGPVWDFDWGTFLPSRTSSFLIKGALYYYDLFNDYYFVSRLKERWAAYVDSGVFDTIGTFIDDTAATLVYSDVMDFAMWESDQTINGDEHDAYNVAVGKLKSAYLAKLAWLKTSIPALVTPPEPVPQGDQDGDTTPFEIEEGVEDW